MTKYIKMEDATKILFRKMPLYNQMYDELTLETIKEISNLPTIEITNDYILRSEVIPKMECLIGYLELYTRQFTYLRVHGIKVPEELHQVIAEAEEFIADLDKLPSGWILVDKESPPKDNPVFCHSIIHGAFQGLFVGGNKFQAQYLGEELNAEFWMPLPPPP